MAWWEPQEAPGDAATFAGHAGAAGVPAEIKALPLLRPELPGSAGGRGIPPGASRRGRQGVTPCHPHLAEPWLCSAPPPGAPSRDVLLVSAIITVSLSVTIVLCGICQWCQRKMVSVPRAGRVHGVGSGRGVPG